MPPRANHGDGAKAAGQKRFAANRFETDCDIDADDPVTATHVVNTLYAKYKKNVR